MSDSKLRVEVTAGGRVQFHCTCPRATGQETLGICGRCRKAVAHALFRALVGEARWRELRRLLSRRGTDWPGFFDASGIVLDYGPKPEGEEDSCTR